MWFFSKGVGAKKVLQRMLHRRVEDNEAQEQQQSNSTLGSFHHHIKDSPFLMDENTKNASYGEIDTLIMYKIYRLYSYF